MASWLIAGVVSLAWCAFSIWLGPRIGFVDRPERSHLTAHKRLAVPLGGVGVYLGVHGAAIARDALDPVLLIASSLVLGLGLVDDRVGLSPAIRLAVQGLSGIVLVTWGALSGSDPWFMVTGVALVIIATNAVNLYDGLDGLAGLSAMVCGLGLAAVTYLQGATPLSGFELSAALVGFLILNWHPARVFLGNCGAYVTGLFLAHLILTASAPSVPETLLSSALLGVFIIDLMASLIRRMRAGNSLFAGDRAHLYDQLRDRGLSVPTVALISGFGQLLLIGVLVAVGQLDTPWLGIVIASALFAAVLALLARLGFLTPRRG